MGSSRNRIDGLGDQAGGEVEATAHAAGVRAGRAVGRLGEVEPLEQLGAALLHVLRRQVVQLAEHAHVLAPGEVLVDGRVLARETDRVPHRIGLLDDVMPGDVRNAGRGREQRGQDPHRGGLAGPVGAEQPDHLPPFDRQVDPVERLHVAEVLHQPLGMDCCIPGHPRTLWAVCDTHEGVGWLALRPRLSGRTTPGGRLGLVGRDNAVDDLLPRRRLEPEGLTGRRVVEDVGTPRAGSRSP